MSAPAKERLASRESSLRALEGTRAEIEQSLFGMWKRLEAYSLPPHAYGAVEASEERLKAFREAIKLYRALSRLVDAIIAMEQAKPADGVQ